jgi:hypothetical protein
MSNYKSIGSFFKNYEPDNNTDKIYEGIKPYIKEYKEQYEHIHKHDNIQDDNTLKQNFQDNILNNNPLKKFKENFKNLNTANPEIWGPPFWFSLHISALHYPENPSKIVKERIKNRILAIPYELPCSSCRPHASSFVENHRHRLDHIVENNENLFKFYVDFHNSVSQRKNKPLWNYEQAKKYYQGKS